MIFFFMRCSVHKVTIGRGPSTNVIPDRRRDEYSKEDIGNGSSRFHVIFMPRVSATLSHRYPDKEGNEISHKGFIISRDKTDAGNIYFLREQICSDPV